MISLLSVLLCLTAADGARSLPFEFDCASAAKNLVFLDSELWYYAKDAGFEGGLPKYGPYIVDLKARTLASASRQDVNNFRFSCKGDKVAFAVDTDWKEVEARRSGPDDNCDYRDLEIWSCDGKLLGTAILSGLHSFDWSPTDNDLLCYSGFPGMSAKDTGATYLWNIQTGKLEMINFVFNELEWSKADNAVYINFDGVGYRLAAPLSKQTAVAERRRGLFTDPSFPAGISPSGKYYVGEGGCVFPHPGLDPDGACKSVDQTPITCVGEYVRILWLSENLLRTDIRLRGLVFDCRSRKWLNVRGFPVSVDKEEKNVIYVGRDWKVLEKPLAECPEVPWDPKRPDESVKEVMDTIDMYPPGAKSPEKAAGAK